jgi:hypothetical protein
MTDAPSTFEGLIAQWGLAPCAQALGLPYSTVNAMKQRNSIPAKYWPALIEHAPADFNITAERLVELATRAGKVAA